MRIERIIDFANGDFALLIKPKKVDTNFTDRFLEKREPEAIREARLAVKTILDGIISDGELKDSEELQQTIKIAKHYVTCYKVEEGRLKKSLKIDELSLKMGFFGGYPIWLIDLISDLHNYLSESRNDLRKIKKCSDCLKLFAAAKNNPRQKYCPLCSKKNHTPAETQAERTRASRKAAKKRKQRELFDSQFKRLIESGHSEKEAKQGAKEYVIEQQGVIE